jgi:polyisoprenoid-binding protein YceI
VWIDARSTLHPINTRTDGVQGFFDLEHDGAGQVDLEGARPTAHLSLPVDRLRSGNAMEERELRRRIDSRRFPTIDGELTAMKTTGTDGSYRVQGELTFHGVTRTYEDEMEVAFLDDGTVRAAGRSTFDVRDFGLEPPRILMFKVEPEVRVRVEIIAKPDPA